MQLLAKLSAFTAIALMANAASAQQARPGYDYAELTKPRTQIQELGTSLFGDKISTYTGTTEFFATDIALPGNNALEVRLGRRIVITDESYNAAGKQLGDWELELPHLHGVFAASTGWQVYNSSGSGGSDSRCSVDVNTPSRAQPPTAIGSDGLMQFQPYQYWYGNSLYVPGSGDERMMVLAPTNTKRPTDGADYRWITSSQWVFSCLGVTANGEPGESFVGRAPNGTKYTFNWFAKRYMPGISMVGGVWPNTTQSNLSRNEIYIYPTTAEDRFGNTVTYKYDPVNPWRLLSITASDGRQITLTYNSNGRLATARAGTQSWQYTYSGVFPLERLSEVVLPDGSSWKLDLTQKPASSGNSGWRDCADIYPVQSGTATKTITHPSGAVGRFTFERRRHGRSNVPKNCMWAGGSSSPFESKFVDAFALIRKEISGPGISGVLAWTFDYQAVAGTWESECPSGSCAPTRTVTVTEPDGSKKLSTFSIKYGEAEGKRLRLEVLDSASQVVSTETTTYQLEPSGQPYPQTWGTIPCYRCDREEETPKPINSTIVSQDGSTHTRSVDTYDAFARPYSVRSWASFGGASNNKTETTVYYDNFANWLLGQIKSSKINDVVASETTYDANALPWVIKSFGKLVQTLLYNADGTLYLMKDGGGHATTLSSWKRGIPQSIKYPVTTESPTGATESAVVNDDGTIASVTDENGYKTCYAYDEMGRLAGVTYPSEAQVGVCDATAWNSRAYDFSPVDAEEYGIPAGHWRRIEYSGNYRMLTYFDALWRPVLTLEQDQSNAVPTRRYVARTYDLNGREAFVSHPTASVGTWAGVTQGTRTTYDALDRVSKVERDSELGILTTTTSYLNNASGPYTLVTNPRTQQTRTWYQMFDQPDYSKPVTVWHPEGTYTHITRDLFGKPTRLRRSNSSSPTGGTIAINRDYTYNGYQELCRTTEPETNATLMGYDAAGNLAWSASGLPASTACDAEGDTAAILARKASRTYDARNRITSLSFPDGLGNTTHAYTPDGLMASVTADNGSTNQVTTNYTYNHRRLLIGERMLWGSVNWPITYTYNANGHLANQTYPGGWLSVAFAPNALGQPTQAGAYATGVSYYPNGAIKQFTYGNGIVHTLTQNARGLPDASKDAYGTTSFLNDGYDYDTNGNVAAITDGATGRNQRGNRTMTYDGLDRLKTVVSPMYGAIGASYTYDALDNLTRVHVGGVAARDHYYCYEAATWRLTFVRNGAVCTGATASMAISALEYDVQGNLKQKDGVAFTFDYGNRLRGVPGVASYVYDGHGRRVRDYTTASKYSLYTQAGQLAFTSDGRAAKYSAYVYLGDSLVAIRDRAHSDSALTDKYQHTDALGSPVAVTDAIRNVLERNEYEPYGKVIAPAAPKDGPGYTGHVYDAATGMNYMQQRYYDPSIGRFLSVDPVTADGNTGGNFNRYWYANNNPYKFTDPDGRVVASVNPSNNQKIEQYINTRANGEFKFDANNQLQRVGDGNTNAFPKSDFYNTQLEAAIQSSTNINVAVQQTINGQSVDTNHGGGVTGVLPNGDIAAIVSGNSLSTVDANGNAITETGADIFMHEMVGHAIPQALSSNPTGNAIANDNKARGEIGLPLAPPDPNHKE
jgi:RHS repeat-associated protein